VLYFLILPKVEADHVAHVDLARQLEELSQALLLYSQW
jgi:hypothetical protein